MEKRGRPKEGKNKKRLTITIDSDISDTLSKITKGTKNKSKILSEGFRLYLEKYFGDVPQEDIAIVLHGNTEEVPVKYSAMNLSGSIVKKLCEDCSEKISIEKIKTSKELDKNKIESLFVKSKIEDKCIVVLCDDEIEQVLSGMGRKKVLIVPLEDFYKISRTEAPQIGKGKFIIKEKKVQDIIEFNHVTYPEQKIREDQIRSIYSTLDFGCVSEVKEEMINSLTLPLEMIVQLEEKFIKTPSKLTPLELEVLCSYNRIPSNLKENERKKKLEAIISIRK